MVDSVLFGLTMKILPTLSGGSDIITLRGLEVGGILLFREERNQGVIPPPHEHTPEGLKDWNDHDD